MVNRADSRYWKKRSYQGGGRPLRRLVLSGCCLTTTCVFGLKFMGSTSSSSAGVTKAEVPGQEMTVWPPLMYGTAWKKEKTRELVVRAVREGFEGIDTACQPKHYREDLVGEALTELEEKYHIPRSSLWIQTKFTPIAGQDRTNMPYKAEAKLEEQVDTSIRVSLTNLGKIDCLLLHSPLRTTKDTIRVWRRLEAALDRGDITTQLGISNCYSLETLESLYQAAKHKPKVLQNRFYQDSHYDFELRRFCAQHNIVYQTFWTLTANGDKLKDPNGPIRKAAKRLDDATPPQILFAWLIQQNHQPLTGTTDPIHMKQDLQAPDLARRLSPDEISSIMNLFSS